MKSSKKSIVIIFVGIVCLIALVAFFNSGDYKMQQEVGKIRRDITSDICWSYYGEIGDYTIEIDKNLSKDIIVYADGFSEYSNDNKASMCIQIGADIPDEYPITYKIKSNGDEYTYDWKTDNLYKNGKLIYTNEYFASDDNSITSNSSSTSTTVTDDEELGTCWALAEEVVESQLKSPSSAKFPFSYSDSDVSITKSGDTYTVKAWVEAENSFGATPQSNFTVTMTKSGTGSNTKFTAESCVIDE